jgi:hypothetical protein
LEWAAPAAGGGFTSLASGSLSSTSTTVNITTTDYKQLVIYVKDVTATADWYPALRLNGDTGSNYTLIYTYMPTSGSVGTSAGSSDTWYVSPIEATVSDNFLVYTIYDPANSTTYKLANFYASGQNSGNAYWEAQSGYGAWRSTAAITSVTFHTLGATYSTGTYEIYGVK